MKVYFDTEFTGLDHRNPQLISIGMIAESGEKFYAEFTDYDKKLINDWVQENVIEKTILYTRKHGGLQWDDSIKYISEHYPGTARVNALGFTYVVGDTRYILEKLNKWLDIISEHGAEQIQLISDVCHYDMYLLCNQVFGGAFNLPSFVNPVCYDICQDLTIKVSIPSVFNCFSEDILDLPTANAEVMKHAFDASREVICKVYNDELPKGDKHNALYDAEVIKMIYEGMRK